MTKRQKMTGFPQTGGRSYLVRSGEKSANEMARSSSVLGANPCSAVIRSARSTITPAARWTLVSYSNHSLLRISVRSRRRSRPRFREGSSRKSWQTRANAVRRCASLNRSISSCTPIGFSCFVRFCLSLRSFRVPVVYLTSAFLWFFSILLFRGINNLRRINHPEGFDSHPGHQFLLSVQAIALCPAEVFAPFSFDTSLIVPKFVPMDFRFSWTFGIYNTSVVATTG